jgi:hypothetical protein
MQTKLDSFIESCVNIAIGYVIAVAGQLLIFPIVGVSATVKQNLVIGVGFTLISLARQYLIRRWFNERRH